MRSIGNMSIPYEIAQEPMHDPQISYKLINGGVCANNQCGSKICLESGWCKICKGRFIHHEIWIREIRLKIHTSSQYLLFSDEICRGGIFKVTLEFQNVTPQAVDDVCESLLFDAMNDISWGYYVMINIHHTSGDVCNYLRDITSWRHVVQIIDDLYTFATLGVGVKILNTDPITYDLLKAVADLGISMQEGSIKFSANRWGGNNTIIRPGIEVHDHSHIYSDNLSKVKSLPASLQKWAMCSIVQHNEVRQQAMNQLGGGHLETKLLYSRVCRTSFIKCFKLLQHFVLQNSIRTFAHTRHHISWSGGMCANRKQIS